ncbi:transcription elongation factor [Stutzerimonas stutzeri]|nr:transcription elongation factor [Stutzerimonas stutzeri]
MLCAPYKSSQYPMDKTHIQTLIVDRLQADLVIARDALKASHEAATHAESKAENKYDTRGLEAAYLADGQRRRVHEIETALVAYRNLPVRPQEGEPIRVGALVALDQEGMARRIFLGPDAAGLCIVDEGQEVLVITPRSPLGQALLGRCEGDEVELLVDGRRQLCEVMAVW